MFFFFTSSPSICFLSVQKSTFFAQMTSRSHSNVLPLYLTGLLLLVFAFSVHHGFPSFPWVCMVFWVAWPISLDCDALWQKINTSRLVWYGDKTVIILMLCLCGLSSVTDVLYWYHCSWSSLCLQRKEMQFMSRHTRKSCAINRKLQMLLSIVNQMLRCLYFFWGHWATYCFLYLSTQTITAGMCGDGLGYHNSLTDQNLH